jgi:subtilase-type serine protease
VLGPVTVQSGGIVAPGNSIGTLTTGVFSILNGGGLSLEIGELTGDQLKINGAGTLAGTINLGDRTSI